MNTKPLTRKQSIARRNLLFQEFVRQNRRLTLSECNVFLKEAGFRIGPAAYSRIKKEWLTVLKKQTDGVQKKEARAPAQGANRPVREPLKMDKEELQVKNGVILRSKERMLISELLQLLGPDSTFQVTRVNEKFYGFIRVRGINIPLTGTIKTID